MTNPAKPILPKKAAGQPSGGERLSTVSGT